MLAYIISAYKDANHLARLVRRLSDLQTDIFVHVDANVDSQPFRDLLPHWVTFVPSHHVSWGGWEQVEYQRELLKAALATGHNYTHIVCLSGQDYPIWSPGHIHEYFAAHPTTEFISGYNITRGTDLGQQSKIRLYHLFRDSSLRPLWIKNKAIVAARTISAIMHITKPLQAPLGDGRYVDVYVGSDYFALTPSCARFVLDTLDASPAFVNYFKSSFTPSEMCIQTIVYNSSYASHAYIHPNSTYPGLAALTPLHYINYHPIIRVLTLDDLPVLLESGRMFCRKVVSGESDELVDEINRTSR